MRKKEVKLLMSSMNGNWQAHCRKMLEAIAKHKQTAEAEGMEPEPHDRELWHLLDTYTGFMRQVVVAHPADSFLL